MSSSPSYQHMYTRVPYTPICVANFLCLLSAAITDDPDEIADRLTQIENYVEMLEHELRIIHTFTHEPGLIPNSILTLIYGIGRLKNEADCLRKQREIMKEENDSGKSRMPVPDFKPCTINIGNGAFKPYKKSCASTESGAQDQHKDRGKSVLNENPIPEPADLTLNLMSLPHIMPAPTSIPAISEPNGDGNRSSNTSKRKVWSAELHRWFVDVVNTIGGPEVATPKLIKQRMGVQDLTYEHIKSHLQVDIDSQSLESNCLVCELVLQLQEKGVPLMIVLRYRQQIRPSASDANDEHDDSDHFMHQQIFLASPAASTGDNTTKNHGGSTSDSRNP